MEKEIRFCFSFFVCHILGLRASEVSKNTQGTSLTNLHAVTASSSVSCGIQVSDFAELSLLAHVSWCFFSLKSSNLRAIQEDKSKPKLVQLAKYINCAFFIF